MRLVPLSSLFEVSYGNKLDLCQMSEATSNEESASFVSRTGSNNGVTATVARLPSIEPYPAGCITVALGGAILSSFLQPAPFYTAQNVAVLRPRERMTRELLLYYCTAIHANKFRYSAFGREANRTLKEMLVPSLADVPAWVQGWGTAAPGFWRDLASGDVSLTPAGRDAIQAGKWEPFTYCDLFDIKKGKRLTKDDMLPGTTLYIGATDSNNGITEKIGQGALHPGGQLTVSYDGSIGEAFYQPDPFWASDAVNVLYPKFKMSVEVALFLVTLIRMEKYRYNYGRKWKLEVMKASVLRLPVASSGEPDWPVMEEIVRGCPAHSVLTLTSKTAPCASASQRGGASRRTCPYP
jgi:hypothetical protein